MSLPALSTHSSHELKERAIQTLIDNDRGGYTIPTAGLYPFQWNWTRASQPSVG
ncbi:MAG: hypothetical protein HC765_08330 [Brachymonas sp.]|nr:hypothetical protein [Brachymonas sp.]